MINFVSSGKNSFRGLMEGPGMNEEKETLE